ncbi:MAG: magnesium transporter [Planctomycetaceae bacterium]|nr:magnesium transporter [Planctomycetaceae bacterium]
MYNRLLLLPDLRELLVADDTQAIAGFCEALHPAAVAEVLEGLEADETWRVLACCSSEQQAVIFSYFDLPDQLQLVETVPRELFSRLIEEMAPDDRVDLLERLDRERVENLLPMVAQAERRDIQRLLSFPDDSAGSIMTTEYASLPAEATVAEALEQLRQQAPDRETIYYVYVIDDGRRLRGFISLRDLILARPETRVNEIMERDVISVRVDDDQEEVAQRLARYDFIAIPVVDAQNQLVGIVTHDDAMDVAQEEADEDAYRSGAVVPLQDDYLSTSLGTLAWKRGGWLVVLLFAAVLTALALQSMRQDPQADDLKWMVLFIPLVLASGGNAGSQSATLVIRALAVSQLERRESVKVLLRELVLAGLLGGGLAVLSFLAAMGFVAVDQAAVVGITVFLVVAMGTVTGAMLPLGFQKMGLDPALMSNPLIAAVVDVVGVIIYYNVAQIVIDGG